MIPFEMVVLDKLMHGSTKMALSQRNDPVEAFFLNRPHKPFGVHIGVSQRLRRARYRVDPT